MPASSATGPVDAVGVAVVGAGYWGPNLLRNFLACDRTWIWSVCDLDLERAQRVVGRYSSIAVTDDLQQVLDDDRIEAVAIATPARTHRAIAEACLRAGKHVLVEKPLALSSRDAEAVIELADDLGLVLMCDHTYCFTPTVQRIKSEIANHRLGALQAIESVRVNLGLVQPDADVFWDLLPHDLSIFDYVLPGGLRPLGVSATASDPIGAGRACIGYASLLLPDDVLAHVQVSWLSPVKVRRTVFGGSDRHLVWDDLQPQLRLSIFERGVDINAASSEEQRDMLVRYRTGDTVSPALAEGEALQGVVTEFATAIREHRAAVTDGHSGLRVVRVLEAIAESVAHQSAVVPLGSPVSS
jgi:predicted dehydrogenase